MGPPKGLSAVARSTSTWIHWWSPVASAKRSTRSWVISIQSVHPRWLPAAPRSSSRVAKVVGSNRQARWLETDTTSPVM